MQKISERYALFISVGFVILMWLWRVVKAASGIDAIVNSIGESVPNMFLLMIVSGVFTVLSVTILLRLSKETYKDIGFDKQNILKQLGIGFLFGVLTFVLDAFIVDKIVDVIQPETAAEGIDMSLLFNNLYFLPVWVFIALFKAGFAEELWRVFTLTRFEKLSGKPGLLFALVFGSVMFGLGHLYQGVGGMISAVVRGLIRALVYLRKRHALEACSAHAAFDIISITLGYIIYSGQ